jgi:AraC-like DNA-binding protein
VFDTSDYPERERERMFLHVHSLSVLIDILSRPVQCRVEVYDLGDMRLRISTSSAQRSTRLPETVAIDRRDAIDIVLVRKGSIHGEVDGRPVSLLAGEALVCDFSRPSALEHGDNETITLDLERRLIAQELPWLEDMNGWVVSGAAAQLLAARLDELSAQLPLLPAAAAPEEARKTAAVVAACLPGPCHAGISSRVLADDVRVLDRATGFIESRLQSAELEPRSIWKAANVSRSRLYRVFASLGGVSRYVVRQRLARAHAALTSPDDARTIARIAHDCGFANVSHFARTFRNAFGQTAREVRKASTTSAARPDQAPAATPANSPTDRAVRSR